MNVIATAKYVRQSPRKVRLVTTAVAPLAPTEAVKALELMPQRAAKVVANVIQSAVANAGHNFQLSTETLRIRTIEVGEGPTLKRMRAASRGRGMAVMKRTSHIRVVLTDEPVPVKSKRAEAPVVATKAAAKTKRKVAIREQKS